LAACDAPTTGAAAADGGRPPPVVHLEGDLFWVFSAPSKLRFDEAGPHGEWHAPVKVNIQAMCAAAITYAKGGYFVYWDCSVPLSAVQNIARAAAVAHGLTFNVVVVMSEKASCARRARERSTSVVENYEATFGDYHASFARELAALGLATHRVDTTDGTAEHGRDTVLAGLRDGTFAWRL
jgi:hypothetical protein